ncbi:MAG TPA: hypothetical protein VEW94_03380 [Chloroflexia bacterium]|nr:hypothetical protein [Chloroflexia bacterium]
MDLDTIENREAAYQVAFIYLTHKKYRLAERYPWDTFVSNLASSINKDATIANTYFVEGVDDISDYLVVPIILKSGSKPAVVQVDVPGFALIRCDAVPLPPDGVSTVSVLDITRLSSLPPGPVSIKVRHNDLPDENDQSLGSDLSDGPEKDFVFELNNEDRVRPTLVWKPCRQSFSPFLPFYKFAKDQFPSLPVEQFYLRADFQVDPRDRTASIPGFVEFDTMSLGF